MKTNNISWKLPLIIVAIIVAVIAMFIFGFQGVQNKAISYEEQITTAQSEIKIQEKRRADLIPNLVDCVKAYDKHEYETLMAVVKERGTNSDAAAEEIKTMIAAVANVRSNYNSWVTKYNKYTRQFPNKQILNMLGYEPAGYEKLNFDVSSDAPSNLFD